MLAGIHRNDSLSVKKFDKGDKGDKGGKWLHDVKMTMAGAKIEAEIQPLGPETALLELHFPGLTTLRDGEACVLAGWNALDQTVCLIDEKGTVSWKPWPATAAELGHRVLTLKRDPKSETPAELVVVGGAVNLGTLTGSGTEHRQVTIFNKGDKPLRIKDQRFSCGCTKGELEANYLQPHGLTRMELSINVSKFKGPNLGLKWLVLTDTPSGRVEIPVEGQIHRPVRFQPDYFNLGLVAPNHPRHELEMELLDLPRGVLPKDVDVKPIDLPSGLKWLGLTRTASGLKVKLAVESWEANRDSTGFFRLEGTLAVTGKAERIYVVGASGRLEPWIQAFPSIVNVGRVKPGARVDRMVRLDCKAAGKMSVSVFQPEYVSAEVKSGELHLKFTAPDRPNVFRTTVMVHIGEHSVKIPIVGELEHPKDESNSVSTTAAAESLLHP